MFTGAVSGFRAAARLALASTLAGALVTPRTARADAPPRVSVEAARAALFGTFRGGFACRGPIALDVAVNAVDEDQARNTMKIAATAHASDPTEDASWPPAPIALEGKLDMVSGFVHLQSLPPAQTRAPRVTLSLTVALDLAGTGLAGTLESGGASCGVVALRRADGSPALARLPAVTAEDALRQAHPPHLPFLPMERVEGTSPAVYWLDLAFRLGQPDAGLVLGAMYEEGFNVSADADKAFRYYKTAGEKGNVPAQAALGRFYSTGRGVARNEAEGQRWTRMAAAATDAAARVCSSPKVVTEISELIQESTSDPSARTLEFFGSLLTGTSIDHGSFRIVEVAAAGVTTAGGPFVCHVTAHHVGVSVDRIPTPDFEYVGTDAWGRALYKDNSTENWIKESVARGMTQLVNAMPFYVDFMVRSQGGSTYQLTMAPTLGLSRQYAATVSVSPTSPVSPAAARRGVVSAAAQPLAPRANASLDRPASGGAAVRRPDDAAIDAAVDTGFVRWSSRWFSDRYERGSAHVTTKESQEAGVRIVGTFSFFRGGTRLTIPFDAFVADDGDNYSVAKLCYSDATTGMRDCDR